MMKKSTKCTEKDDKAKRKASRVLNLGDFGLKLAKKINRKECAADTQEGCHVQMPKCEACKSSFNAAQRLASHRFHCEVAKAAVAVQEEEMIKKKCCKNFLRSCHGESAEACSYETLHLSKWCCFDKLCG